MRLFAAALVALMSLTLTACPHGHHKTGEAREDMGKPKDPPPPDQCPEVDGVWNLADGSTVTFSRKEGFLQLESATLGAIVMDGKTRRLESQKSDVTATCTEKVIEISYKSEDAGETKIMKQQWRADLEKDLIAIVEKEDGQKTSYSQAARKY